MFSAKSSTQDGKLRPWQSHVKVKFGKPGGGSGFLFFRNGCDDKKSRSSLGFNVEKWGPCQGLKNEHVQTSCGAGARFFSKGVWQQMFSIRLWARDGKVRSWPAAKKISLVLAGFGTRTLFLEKATGDKCFRRSLRLKMGRWGPGSRI